MNLSSALRPVEMPGTSNLSLQTGNTFGNLFREMVGSPFGVYQDGRNNYDEMVGAPNGNPTGPMTMTEHDEANISYSIPIKNTTEFPPVSLYKEILAFILNEGENGSSASNYVVVPLYSLNRKLRLDFFEGKKKLLSFIENEIIPILVDSYHLFPELLRFYNTGGNDNDFNLTGPLDMFDDEEREENDINREQFEKAATNIAIELLYETMPEEMQLFQDKNKIKCWSELPSVVDCSAMEGRKQRNTVIDAIDRLFKKTEEPDYLPPITEDDALNKKVNEYSKILNASSHTGKYDVIDTEVQNEESEFGGVSNNPFMKMLLKIRMLAEVKARIKSKYREYIMSALMLAKSSQINGNKNFIPYLMAGGYWDNWYMYGVLNTMFQGRDAHKFDITKASVEIARVVTDRISKVSNIWGPNLSRGDVLYLKVMRSPVGNLNIEQSLRNPGQLGWNGYGSFFIHPCITHVTKSMEETEDLMYYDIFGKLQKALLINVGVVQYDTADISYPAEERLKAIGLPHPSTGQYPTENESKKAMIRLPKVEILVRRRGY